MKQNLTIDSLKKAAKDFCLAESKHKNKDLYGVTDGKAVETYIEHRFQKYLEDRFVNGISKMIDKSKSMNCSEVQIGYNALFYFS